MLTIGLDIGTTSLCGLLADSDDGSVLKTVSRPNSYFIKTPNEWERIQDADKICGAVTEILDELYSDDVGCIGLTGQMHGIVYLDSEGKLLSPLYTWQDARGDLPVDGSTCAAMFGAPSGYGLTTDYYNERFGLVPDNAAVVCTVHDYVAMRISGRTTPVVHASDAASLGRYDCESGRFDCRCPRLPETARSLRIIGEYKKAAVCTAVGDNQASFIGSVSGDSPLINVGTGSQVSVVCSGFPKLDGLETRPLDGDSSLLVGSSLCGGRAFAIVERFFRDVVFTVTGEKRESVYEQLDRLLELSADTDLVFDCRFCGTREEPERRAGLYNISESNFTAASVLRASLNGIADELYGFYSLTGQSCSAVVGSGNGIRKNPALRRVLEKKFGCEVMIPAHREEAAYGAALCAMYAAGAYKTLKQARSLIKYQTGEE